MVSVKRNSLWYVFVRLSSQLAQFTLEERYDMSILNSLPMGPSIAHPACSPKPIATLKFGMELLRYLLELYFSISGSIYNLTITLRKATKACSEILLL